MDNDVSNILKNNRIFASLDDATRQEILPQFTKVEIKQSGILFYQDDPSDFLYILIRGKLASELTKSSGETKIVGHIDPGELVGELGVLANEPRTLTVKALKDSTLLKFPAQDFIDLCHRTPAIMLASVQPILSRSSSLIQILSTEKSNHHIVIVPAHKDISLEEFSEKLRPHAEHFFGLLFISDYQPEFSDKNAETNKVKEIIDRMAASKKPSHRVLYILQSHDTPLARVAFKKTDMIYVAGYSQVEPKIDHHVIEKIQSHILHLRSDPELILLHPEGTLTPQNTSAWLAQAQFALHHHVRLDKAKDYQRILRFIRGKAVGVVLSGGGTRGWAHIGAIKALREAKVPIDMIGGASVGGIVAACYAINESFDECYDKFNAIVSKSEHSTSWRSLTWPAISLFDAKNFTEAQQSIFGDLLIEDMWLPYFCVSCNLTDSTEDVHHTGLLWERTRASSSIPGLIPPMIIDGDLHLDGGVLNNLPVDTMRQFIGIRGKIIAVDLNSFAPDHRKYQFPPILTFKDALLSKMGVVKYGYKYPRFIDMFLRGLFVGSLSKSRQNSLAANFFISLNLSKFRVLHINRKQADRMLEIGYHETLLKCMYEINIKK